MPCTEGVLLKLSVPFSSRPSPFFSIRVCTGSPNLLQQTDVVLSSSRAASAEKKKQQDAHCHITQAPWDPLLYAGGISVPPGVLAASQLPRGAHVELCGVRLPLHVGEKVEQRSPEGSDSAWPSLIMVTLLIFPSAASSL